MGDEHDDWMGGLGVDIGALRQSVTDTVTSVENTVTNTVSDLGQGVRDGVQSVVETVQAPVTAAIDTTVNTVVSAVKAVGEAASGAVSSVEDVVPAAAAAAGADVLGVLPDLPPRDISDGTDDPNTVFAGEHFKIKMVDAVGFGEVLGLSTIAFAIWDTDNNRSAGYEYLAPIVTVGTPITFTGEGDWSDTFTTSQPTQVDQFAGLASHAAIGALFLGAMNFSFGGSNGVSVNVPTGFSKGGGIEAGTGVLRLISGSVQVFKG
jgi:hypothetical protein